MFEEEEEEEAVTKNNFGRDKRYGALLREVTLREVLISGVDCIIILSVSR